MDRPCPDFDMCPLAALQHRVPAVQHEVHQRGLKLGLVAVVPKFDVIDGKTDIYLRLQHRANQLLEVGQQLRRQLDG